MIAFFVLAYAVAWGFVPFGSFGAFGALVAALIVIPLVQGRAGLRELAARLIRWRVGWLWYAVALGVPLGVHLATAGLTAHSVEGSIQAQGWIYMGVWCAVALGLLVADRMAWRRPVPVEDQSLLRSGR